MADNYTIGQIENRESGYSARAKINSNSYNLAKDLKSRPTQEDIQKLRTPYFTTLEELQAARPDATPGDKAWVGDPYPGTVWNFTNANKWENTGKTPPAEEVDLAKYLKRENLSATVTADSDTAPTSEAVRKELLDRIEVISRNKSTIYKEGRYLMVHNGRVTFNPNNINIPVDIFTLKGFVNLNGVINEGAGGYRMSEILPLPLNVTSVDYTSQSHNVMSIAFLKNGVFVSGLTGEINTPISGVPSIEANQYIIVRNLSIPYTEAIFHTSGDETIIENKDAITLIENTGSEVSFTVLNKLGSSGQRRDSSICETLKGFTLNGATITTDTVNIVGSGNASDYQLLLDYYIRLERLTILVVVEIVSSNATINLGRAGGNRMTIKNDEVEIYKINPDTGLSQLRETLPLGFTLEKGDNISLIQDKIDEYTLAYSVVSDKGVFRVSYDKRTGNDNLLTAIAWGRPSLGVIEGEIKVRKVIVSSRYSELILLLIKADSLGEGNNLISNGSLLSERWVSMLADKIGKDRCVISGKGGEKLDTHSIKALYKELEWMAFPKYVMIELGVNNTDVGNFKTLLSNVISEIKSNGQIPILCTCMSMNQDYDTVVKPKNDFIRSTGELYLDVHKAVTKPDNEREFREGYVLSDGVHLTGLGNKAIESRFPLDIPELLML